MTSNSKLGEIEEFIKSFQNFEIENKLFEKVKDIDGFPLWDLVRYDVQYDLAVERELLTRVPNRDKTPFLKSLSNKAIKSVELISDLFFFLQKKNYDTKYVFTCRNRRNPINHRIRESQNDIFLIKSADCPYLKEKGVRKTSVLTLARLFSPFFKLPSHLEDLVSSIEKDMHLRFETSLNLRSIVQKHYKKHKFYLFYYKKLFSRMPMLKEVGFIGDGTLKTMVFVANNDNIATTEYQHGYMGDSHFNYSYPVGVFDVLTIPQKVVPINSLISSSYPTVFEKIPVFTGKKSLSIDEYKKRSIDILVGSSFTRVEETLDVLENLSKLDVVVAVKAHPNQPGLKNEIIKRGLENQITVYLDTDLSFNDIIQKSKIYVPINPISTTGFEAVESGAKLVLIHYAGRKITSMLDGFTSDQAYSYVELKDKCKLLLNSI